LPPLGNPLPPLSPIPSVGPIPSFGGAPAPQFAPQRVPRRGFGSAGFPFFPYYYGDLPFYPAAYSAPVEPAPPVTIIQQFGAPPQANPPPPVTPQVHEYPAPAGPAESSAEPATFAIVLQDGSVLSASAATVQKGVLQIVDPNGEHRRIPLDSIDREATRRRNAERNLRLQLQ